MRPRSTSPKVGNFGKQHCNISRSFIQQPRSLVESHLGPTSQPKMVEQHNTMETESKSVRFVPLGWIASSLLSWQHGITDKV